MATSEKALMPKNEDRQTILLTEKNPKNIVRTPKQGVAAMRKDQNSITDRVMLVLDREARRVCEAAERVRLVVHAEALRRGVVAPGQITYDAADASE